MSVAEWIAVDWGTSNLRAWAMQGVKPFDQVTSNKGMGGLTPDQFAPILAELLGDWLDGNPPIFACGMLGARQGWIEAPYRATPCAALAPASELTKAPTDDPRLNVYIAPGVSQDKPADVMRGEETQIAGFLSQSPSFDGILCLPGTHTKWVHISAGEIVSFRTFMSGELFALLSKQSVLRHSVDTDQFDDAAFGEAVSDAMSRPERLAAELFGLRASGLLHGQPPDVARARLSGLLIGAELAAARPYWLGQPVALIGEPDLSWLYARALGSQGLSTERADSASLTLAGLSAIYHSQKGTP